jgi:hypothetical protein
MARKLAYTVGLFVDGETKFYGPDDEVPPEIAKQIGEHAWEPEESKTDGPPAKAGKGSSKEAWVAYAEASGVAVPDGASREEIVAALDDAGVPTE